MQLSSRTTAAGSPPVQNLPCLTVLGLCSGAVVLQISCFAEAERIYMLAKDTVVNNKTLTSLVIPEIQVTLS